MNEEKYKERNRNKQRKYQDRKSEIKPRMEEAKKNINWERRTAAEKSLGEWVKTYCVPSLLNDPPPELGIEVLNQMEATITSHHNFMISMGRGSGKTSYVECCALYALATGLQKFIVVISANQTSATNIMQDIFRVVSEAGTDFANDYPEITQPFILQGGSSRRRITYNGHNCDTSRNASQICFARLVEEDGTELPTSSACIMSRGISGSVRGLKHGSLRPSFVILDDLQTSEVANNPQAVEKLYTSIKSDIIPLAGKERLSILQTATPICANDLVDRIKKDKNWTTMIFPSIINYPKNSALWDEYFRIYDEECTSEKDGHGESLSFYKQNQVEMDEGSKVFNPTRFSERDGHISAIQKLLELKHTLGEQIFNAEYQMVTMAKSYQLDIDERIVASRQSTLNQLEIPKQNVAFVVASSDLNLSKYITTTVLVFMRDSTVHIIHTFFTHTKINYNLPPEQFYKRTYDALSNVGQELKKLNIRIDGWAIDGGGTPFDAVKAFAKESRRICGIPAICMLGRASTNYRDYPKSRLKEAVARTVLCGDDDEKRMTGSGTKWQFWDSDLYREKTQLGFLTNVGNLGSISWAKGLGSGKWAIQVVGERLESKQTLGDGSIVYKWTQTTQDHDALDSIAQGLACFASQGIATSTNIKTQNNMRLRQQQRQIRLNRMKPRIRIV